MSSSASPAFDGAGEAQCGALQLLVQLDFGGNGLTTCTKRHRCEVEVGGVEHDVVDRLADLDGDGLGPGEGGARPDRARALSDSGAARRYAAVGIHRSWMGSLLWTGDGIRLRGVEFGPPPIRSAAMERDTILVRVSGTDRPGITAGLLRVLAAGGADVLDMEQVVVRDRLSLGLLVGVPGGREVLKELLLFGWEQKLHLDFELLADPVPPQPQAARRGDGARRRAVGSRTPCRCRVDRGGRRQHRADRLPRPLPGHLLRDAGLPADLDPLRAELLGGLEPARRRRRRPARRARPASQAAGGARRRLDPRPGRGDRAASPRRRVSSPRSPRSPSRAMEGELDFENGAAEEGGAARRAAGGGAGAGCGQGPARPGRADLRPHRQAARATRWRRSAGVSPSSPTASPPSSGSTTRWPTSSRSRTGG